MTILKKNTLLFICLLITLCITYWPALVMPYVYHDEFRFWERIPGSLAVHSLYYYLFAFGRFLGATILTIVGWLVNNVTDLNMIRFITLMQLGLCGLFLMVWWHKYFVNPINSFLATIIILTLPPFQSIAMYAPNCIIATAILLSLWAAVRTSQISLTEPWERRIISPSAILSILFLFFALSIYASAATFYWIIVAIVILSNQAESQNNFKNQLINFFSIGTIALVIYALILKLFKSIVIPHTFGMYNPYVLTTDVLGRLKWFMREPLVNALNLWNIFPKTSYAIIAFIFILSGGLISIRDVIKHYRNGKKGENFVRRFLNLFLFLLLLILSFLPNLLASGEAPFYRCSTALTSIILLTLLWAIQQWLSVFPKPSQPFILTFILFIGFIYGVLQAQKTVLYDRVIPSSIEFNYIKHIFKKTDLNQYKQIYFIRPQLFNLKYRYDEFAAPSTHFPQDSVGITLCVARELGKENQVYSNRMKITSATYPPTESDLKESTLIIDMTKLFNSSRILQYLREETKER